MKTERGDKNQLKKARYVYGAQFGNISLGGETRNHVPDSFLRGGNFLTRST